MKSLLSYGVGHSQSRQTGLLRMASMLKFACVVAVLTAVCMTAPLRAADNQGTWSVAAQMTAARTEIGGVALNGKIYVAGGQEMGRPDTTLFQLFDPTTATWKDLAPMPKGASHVGLAVLDG